MPFEVTGRGRPTAAPARRPLDGRGGGRRSRRACARPRGPRAARVVFDAAGIEALDLTGAWLLHSLERQLERYRRRVEWAGGRPAQLEFIDRMESERRAKPRLPRRKRPTGLPGILDELGRAPCRRGKARSTCSVSSAQSPRAYGRIFGSLKRLRLPVDRAARLRDGRHRRADRLADRLPDRGHRRLHRRAAAAASSAARSSSSTS